MQLRLIRLKLRRRLHLGQRQVEDLGKQAELGIERHLFKRFTRLYKVRRFVLTWLVFMGIIVVGLSMQTYLLSGYFQTLRPVPGGIYNEGVIGTFTTANPIYATNDVDTTISHLIFSGLFSYNDQNKLVGNLASGYQVDARGSTYTVRLRPNLTWQDGKPLTAGDIAFTYHLIQDPDAQSPLISSWQGITVKATGPLTISFQLPDPLASFPYQMTNGILPQHLLRSIPPTEMRSASFNTTNPVGSGPFSWRAIQVIGNDPTTAEEQIALAPFAHFQGGDPKLQEIVVHAFATDKEAIGAYKSGKLNGLEGLGYIPSSIKNKSLDVHNLLLTAGVYVFFKTSNGVLADKNVRQALVQAVNVPGIVNGLGYPTHAVNEPLLEGQLGYNASYKEPGYSVSAAADQLISAGWILKNGVRQKNGQTLGFTLTLPNSPEYQQLGNKLQNYWKKVGAKVQLLSENNSDFSSTLQDHEYDAVLYGISEGIDPDVFVYWDGSQADVRASSRLNLSEFTNTAANESLEEGRTRIEPNLRVIKYQPFLQSWQQALPALGLYQPRLLYLTNGPVSGLNDHILNSNSDRFDNIANWEINEAKITDN